MRSISGGGYVCFAPIVAVRWQVFTFCRRWPLPPLLDRYRTLRKGPVGRSDRTRRMRCRPRPSRGNGTKIFRAPGFAHSPLHPLRFLAEAWGGQDEGATRTYRAFVCSRCQQIRRHAQELLSIDVTPRLQMQPSQMPRQEQVPHHASSSPPMACAPLIDLSTDRTTACMSDEGQQMALFRPIPNGKIWFDSGHSPSGEDAPLGGHQALLHLPSFMSNFTFPAARIRISKSCRASVLLLLGSSRCCSE